MLEDKGYDEVQVLNLYYEKLSDNIKLLNYREEKSFIVKNLLVGSQNQVIQSLLLKNHVTSENRGYYACLLYTSRNVRTLYIMKKLRNMSAG